MKFLTFCVVVALATFLTVFFTLTRRPQDVWYEENGASATLAAFDAPALYQHTRQPTVLEADSVSNPFDRFARVYYINLDSRPDRRDSIESELCRMGVPRHKIQRVPGVIHSAGGAAGCSSAHLNALRDCQRRGLENCLVVEDDLVFQHSRKVTFVLLNRVWKTNLHWDVLMLSTNTFQSEATQLDSVSRVLEAQTTAGYAVTREYLPTLLHNVEEGLARLVGALHDGEDHSPYCIDMYWKSLQPQHAWYTFHPLLAHQREDYSDIEHRHVAYVNTKPTLEAAPLEFLVMVKTCQPRLRRDSAQRRVLEGLSQNHPIGYYYYYSRPELAAPWVLHETDHEIVLRTEDDYLNLPHKFISAVQVVHDLMRQNSRLRHLKGVFFTDDDIEVFPERFYQTLGDNVHVPYWGRVGYHDVGVSGHLENKAKESPAMKAYFQEHYPSVLKHRIRLYPGAFCAGGGFFLRSEMLPLLLEGLQWFAPFPTSNARLLQKLKDNVIEDVSVFDDVNVAAALHAHGVVPKNLDVRHIVRWEDM